MARDVRSGLWGIVASVVLSSVGSAGCGLAEKADELERREQAQRERRDAETRAALEKRKRRKLKHFELVRRMQGPAGAIAWHLGCENAVSRMDDHCLDENVELANIGFWKNYLERVAAQCPETTPLDVADMLIAANRQTSGLPFNAVSGVLESQSRDSDEPCRELLTSWARGRGYPVELPAIREDARK